MIDCKRAYAPAEASDGCRVLVDRLWPRNCPRQQLALVQWLPQVAPSTALRRAFKTAEIDFAHFRLGYRQELAAQPGHWWQLLELAERGPLTLIYAARHETQNNARVLAEWLEDELDRCDTGSSPGCYAELFKAP